MCSTEKIGLLRLRAKKKGLKWQKMSLYHIDPFALCLDCLNSLTEHHHYFFFCTTHTQSPSSRPNSMHATKPSPYGDSGIGPLGKYKSLNPPSLRRGLPLGESNRTNEIVSVRTTSITPRPALWKTWMSHSDPYPNIVGSPLHARVDFCNNRPARSVIHEAFQSLGLKRILSALDLLRFVRKESSDARNGYNCGHGRER